MRDLQFAVFGKARDRRKGLRLNHEWKVFKHILLNLEGKYTDICFVHRSRKWQQGIIHGVSSHVEDKKRFLQNYAERIKTNLRKARICLLVSAHPFREYTPLNERNTIYALKGYVNEKDAEYALVNVFPKTFTFEVHCLYKHVWYVNKFREDKENREIYFFSERHLAPPGLKHYLSFSPPYASRFKIKVRDKVRFEAERCSQLETIPLGQVKQKIKEEVVT